MEPQQEALFLTAAAWAGLRAGVVSIISLGIPCAGASVRPLLSPHAGDIGTVNEVALV